MDYQRMIEALDQLATQIRADAKKRAAKG